jgi:hypothetical protein
MAIAQYEKTASEASSARKRREEGREGRRTVGAVGNLSGERRVAPHELAEELGDGTASEPVLEAVEDHLGAAESAEARRSVSVVDREVQGAENGRTTSANGSTRRRK